MGVCCVGGDGISAGEHSTGKCWQTTMFHSSEAAVVLVSRRSSISAPYDSSRPHHPPTLTMVLEAVQVLDNPKGVSAFAIKRYILHRYPGVDPVRLKYYLKLALEKGVNHGYLVRPPRSSAQGASGSFKVRGCQRCPVL